MSAPAPPPLPARWIGTAQCVHCGMCLEACPTYRLYQRETDSPRGRLYFLRLVEERESGVTGAIKRHFVLCLGCRACESACPSLVSYGEMLEGMRDRIVREFPGGPIARVFRAFFLRFLFPRPWLLNLLGKALAIYERTGLRDALRRAGFMRLLPRRLREMEALTPDVMMGPVEPLAPSPLPRRGRAAMFTGCVMEAVFPRVNRMTEALVASAGYEVAAPRAQACCGALHLHVGGLEGARSLARRNIAAFEAAAPDVIVINAAGCGAVLKDYGRLLAFDPAWAARAAAFAAKVKDVSELLDEALPSGEFGALPVRALYQDACHLAHGQGVRKPPRRLLARIRGLSLVEIEESDWCCGSAGVYNILQPETALAPLDIKMDAVARANPQVIVTANPGCFIQYKLGVKRKGLPCDVRFLVEVLYEARRNAPPRA
ncbi:MAG: (Fe-S)-binding protein [Planctomycetota bacterium]